MRESFDIWLRKVERRFLEQYCLSLVDIGAEPDCYALAYAANESAKEYVDTHAAKYGLTHIDDFIVI